MKNIPVIGMPATELHLKKDPIDQVRLWDVQLTLYSKICVDFNILTCDTIIGGVKKDGITCVFNFGDETWGVGGEQCGQDDAEGGLFAGMGMFDDEE